MKDFFQKYGRFFWVLNLLIAFWELYRLLFTSNGELIIFLIWVGMTYWFWGMSKGKFSNRE